MPPYVSRKRDSSPAEVPEPKRKKAAVRGKKSVFDDVDSHRAVSTSAADTKAYLDQIDDESELSSLDDDDDDNDDDHAFEDVPGVRSSPLDRNGDGEDDDDIAWENAIDHAAEQAHAEVGDVSISITEDGVAATATDRAASTLRKGPSRRERDVRNGTHYVHVQSLVWHNAIRNSWLNDSELHRILLDGLPEGIKIEIDRYRSYMGMVGVTPLSTAKKRRGTKGKSANSRGSRDWEADAKKMEIGAVNRSGGDPILRLLKLLTAYWRKRFSVSAPGLRKLGYMPLKRLTAEVNSWKKDKANEEKHGERIEDKVALRKLAKACRGSRDVGSQLFTALLRALGLEARMVANLQPAGIGWGKVEEAKAVRPGVSNGEDDAQTKSPSKGRGSKQAIASGSKAGGKTRSGPAKEAPSATKVISLDTDDEGSLSSGLSDMESDASLIDVTDLYVAEKPKKRFDRDMTFPNYWTEVLSPVSNSWVPVDPIVLSTVATNPELVASFEPRGKAADQAKQVMCYTVAHSADGTAKDVTVRYLKKHQLPGRTKGYRIAAEKIKVYNKKGKVLRYEDYDWFKTVMSLFARPYDKRTPADDLEESTDLKPFENENEKPKVDAESLQWYKQSAEFVLERHLRREEAIPSTAQPVKTFTTGKGDKTTSEPVYKRSVVVPCKTAESWHKEGRQIKLGEQPMKLVPMRAVTTTRKREMEEVERETGEKAKQGLFARAQTEWIIPPPIGPDREIPRNAFGNIDVYVPSMVPEGAVHVKLKGTARICRDLGVSHAEAVTGFEFGKRMAIPVITGVVVASENRAAVVDAWRVREAERRRKEEAKRTERCLTLWRKLCSGLRIQERMRREYAGKGAEEDNNPFVRRATLATRDEDGDTTGHQDGRGGFLRDGDSDEEKMSIDLGGGFVVDEDGGEEDSGMAASTPASEHTKPVSLRAAHGSLQQYVFDAPSPTRSELGEQDSEEEVKPKVAKRTSKARPAAARRVGKKTSATRSKYFSPPSSSSELSDAMSSPSSAEEEVVAPRRTTARTRKK